MSKKIILLSFILSLTTLVIERLVGINWDYHMDSVTYRYESANIVNALMEMDVIKWINGGYYFYVNMLGGNIYAVTFNNMIMYSLTNYFIYKLCMKNSQVIFIYLILFNPYRLHLSTTMLKETIIIFILVAAYYFTSKRRALLLSSLVFLRVASLIYFVTFISKKNLIKLLFIGFFVSFFFFQDILLLRLDESNEVDLSSRSFDSISTFQEYSYFGSLLRFIIWPFYAITGSYALISPAGPYFAVAIGSWMSILYCFKNKLNIFDFRIYIGMGIFAVLAPGFTSYIRYVYPLVVLLPVILTFEMKMK